MKALRTLTILFALALMCLPAPSAAAAEKPFKLDICAMPEHESFIFWYAKEQGWDKDEGLDFQIHFFQFFRLVEYFLSRDDGKPLREGFRSGTSMCFDIPDLYVDAVLQ